MSKKRGRGEKKVSDPDMIRTRNLLIWSQTRFHCATETPDSGSANNVFLMYITTVFVSSMHTIYYSCCCVLRKNEGKGYRQFTKKGKISLKMVQLKRFLTHSTL